MQNQTNKQTNTRPTNKHEKQNKTRKNNQMMQKVSKRYAVNQEPLETQYKTKQNNSFYTTNSNIKPIQLRQTLAKWHYSAKCL